jgi:hypothetical protein
MLARIHIQHSLKLFFVLCVSGYNGTFILVLKHLVKSIVAMYVCFQPVEAIVGKGKR